MYRKAEPPADDTPRELLYQPHPRGAGRLRRAAILELRVESGELSVRRPSRAIQARVRLRDLADVVLDTKTIRPVVDGTSGIPAMRFIDSRVAPEVDTARIALVDREGTSINLDEDYLSYSEATEWFGKVRVFLRRHGWVPTSEEEGDE